MVELAYRIPKCPKCNTINSFKIEDNYIICNHCGQEYAVDYSGGGFRPFPLVDIDRLQIFMDKFKR